ncbi:MAG TPA: thioredoxin domain-containing protein [Gaiellaceae bacterium]|nr:thioredoxin domain-containing protein [Gaiellaceae bacterium]
MRNRLGSQRLVLLAVAVAVAAIAVGVVLALSGGGSSSAGDTTTVSTSTGGGNQESAFTGVAQQGLKLGPASAPASLYVFEDPQCPYCKQWSLDSIPATIEQLVKTGKVNLVLRPIEVIGADSEPGIRAVYAAARYNRGWSMLEALYQRQGQEGSGWITKDVIAAAAREAGLSPAKVEAAMNTPAVTSQWRDAQQTAQQWGVAGTPTFVLLKQLGTPTQVNPASLEPADFTSALQAALQ